MAAFHTSVLRDGEWVRETVDTNAALKASADLLYDDTVIEETKPIGIFSRTIVHNPKVNLILPVCLRSKDCNDIAFIGDHSIHIKEQKNDGQQVEVLPHHHVDGRIRNAVVIGTPPAIADERDDVKTESLDRDVDMLEIGTGSRSRTLPPQILVLVLETGDLIFVFIETDAQGSNPKLVVKTVPPTADIPYLGHHLAVDPSFRYIASASPDEALVVYQLKSLDRLAKEFQADGTFEPVLERFTRLLRAVIHSVDFLYPRPQDDYHIILILTVCNKESSKRRAWRLQTFDWEAGEPLKDVLGSRHQKAALRLPDLPDIPTFIIPLRFQSTFFMVFRSIICLVKQTLSVPEYEFIRLPDTDKSKFHYGVGEPLWTAWARPFRRKSYTQNTDIIYLAREDGIVIHLELESDSLMTSVTQIGCLNINIGRAFTAAYDVFSDLLIIGGDAGPGGVWKLPARSEFEQISSIPNWSPVIDAVTTEGRSPNDSGPPSRPQSKPVKMFLATRRGAQGSLVEPRVGMQARVGLDMDFGEPTRDAWMFPDIRSRDGSSYAIVSLPHSSTVLCFSSDFKSVHAEAGETAPFDTSCRTIFATQASDNMILQVTETSITLVTPSQSSRHSFDDTLAMSGVSAQKAHCIDDVIVIYLESHRGSHVCVLRVDQMAVSLESTWEIQENLNCLSLLPYPTACYVITGCLSAEHPSIAIYSLSGELVARQELRKDDDSASTALEPLEALTSLVIVQETFGGLVIAAGTRCGHLLTIQIKGLQSEAELNWKSEKMSLSAVHVFAGTNSYPTAFCCCDDKLIHLSRPSTPHPRFEGKDIVWPVDLNDTWTTYSPVHSVFSLQSDQYGSAKSGTLLLLAGTRILLADFIAEVTSVPRTMDLPGAPTKMLYSPLWKCLIIGVQTDNKPTITFIDPESGETLSYPVDKDKVPCGIIGGLGQPGDRICSLFEWIYVKDGQTFPFIIVTTQEGCLLIVSVRELYLDLDDGSRRRALEHWTRYRKKGFKEPVYSAVPDNEGLLYCVGRTLHWDILDLTEKKMKQVSTIDLDSTAMSLSLLGDKVLALTARHSLHVVSRKPGFHEMTLVHTDSHTRASCHVVRVGPEGDDRRWPVNLVSDLAGGITGLFVPDRAHKDLVHVFEGRLKSAVRRFARVKCRQPWTTNGRSGNMYGSIQSTPDDGDILGVSLNGTIQQFKLLGLNLWRVMYIIQALVLGRDTRRDGLPVSVLKQHWGDELPSEVHAGLMHIDGDALMGCLQSRSLERLASEAGMSGLLCFCLDDLEEGALTEHFSKEGDDAAREAQYFALAYEILEYLFSSAM